MKKYKTIKKLKKKFDGEGELLEVPAFAAAGDDGNHPLMAILHQCGYQNVMLIHGELGTCQAGSWRTEYGSQLQPNMETYDVPATGEDGFVLDREHDSVLKDQSNLATILMFREKSKAGQQALMPVTKIAYEGVGWKVVNKQARAGDKGGMLAAQAVKTREPLKEGWFQNADENGDYWQLWVDGVADNDNYSYTPSAGFDVVEGQKYLVTDNRTTFDAVATKSGTPYVEATWPTLCHDVLGQEVTVNNIVNDSDWPGYNVNVTTETGATHQIPIRALRVKDEGQTALFMGEVGMFILTAEMKLFADDGHSERGRTIQPLVSEFKGVCEALCQADDLGFMEVVDPEDDERFYNLQPDIQAWCTEKGTDWSYDNY